MDYGFMGDWAKTVEVWMNDNKKKDETIAELMRSLKDLVQENKKFQDALSAEKDLVGKLQAQNSQILTKIKEKNFLIAKLSKIISKPTSVIETPKVVHRNDLRKTSSSSKLELNKQTAPVLARPELHKLEVPKQFSGSSCQSIMNFAFNDLSSSSCNSVHEDYSMISDHIECPLTPEIPSSPKHQLVGAARSSKSSQDITSEKLMLKNSLGHLNRSEVWDDFDAKVKKMEKQLEESFNTIDELKRKIRQDTNKYEEIILKLKQEIVDTMVRAEQSERENSLNSKYFERKLNEKDVNYKKLLDELEVLKKINRSLLKGLEKYKSGPGKAIVDQLEFEEETLTESLLAEYSERLYPKLNTLSPREFLRINPMSSAASPRPSMNPQSSQKKSYKIVLKSPTSPSNDSPASLSKSFTMPKRCNSNF